MPIDSILARNGFRPEELLSGELCSISPIDGAQLGNVDIDAPASAEQKFALAKCAFLQWREVPAPRRGELVRQFAAAVRARKNELADLICLEAGKIRSEALGEVQEVIDVCDFAVGLSRQLHGLTIASERAAHHMLERWQPLGPVGVITAFNFPMAVWAWNAALALVCGDSLVWKPSEKTPLCALALHRLMHQCIVTDDSAPEGLSQLLLGGRELGELLGDCRHFPLISATGSTAMGRALGPRIAARFGRALLELGGNNAAIVAPSADLDNAARSIVFSAAGTAGQRCTSLRRLIVHESLLKELRARLLRAFARLPVGNPLDATTLVGPLIDAAACSRMQQALERARAAGCAVHGGERVAVPGCAGGYYVRPALVDAHAALDLLQQETFAPILYLLPYGDFSAALALQNAVRQGLSSALYTQNLLEAERFLSATGSDCGIANINTGTSGAEIGGAFGGEKETGGGRESGSDSWKAYMRRQTQTVNYSNGVQLAQGVEFDV